MQTQLLRASFALSALILFAAGNQAMADASCRQDNATYIEERSGARLTFRPNEYGAATYYLMELELTSGQIFDGAIQWGNGYSIPRAALELQDCQVSHMNECRKWEAVAYSLWEDGLVDYIGINTAAEQVLMPELAAHLYFFKRARTDDPQWDLTYTDRFMFESCGSASEP